MLGHGVPHPVVSGAGVAAAVGDGDVVQLESLLVLAKKKIELEQGLKSSSCEYRIV